MRPTTNEPSTIYRYEVLPEAGKADLGIELPEGAQFLCLDRSGREGVAAMWFLIPLTTIPKPGAVRRFRILGTGHEVPPGYQYCGSTPEGAFVWHVFENVALRMN